MNTARGKRGASPGAHRNRGDDSQGPTAYAAVRRCSARGRRFLVIGQRSQVGGLGTRHFFPAGLPGVIDWTTRSVSAASNTRLAGRPEQFKPEVESSRTGGNGEKTVRCVSYTHTFRPDSGRHRGSREHPSDLTGRMSLHRLVRLLHRGGPSSMFGPGRHLGPVDPSCSAKPGGLAHCPLWGTSMRKPVDFGRAPAGNRKVFLGGFTRRPRAVGPQVSGPRCSAFSEDCADTNGPGVASLASDDPGTTQGSEGSTPRCFGGGIEGARRGRCVRGRCSAHGLVTAGARGPVRLENQGVPRSWCGWGHPIIRHLHANLWGASVRPGYNASICRRHSGLDIAGYRKRHKPSVRHIGGGRPSTGVSQRSRLERPALWR